MLKIRIASDLHVDINTKYYDLTNVEIMQKLNLYNIDVLILAGDTAEYPKNLNFIDFISKFYPNLKIIEVGGNHLYYSCSTLQISINDINKACKTHNEYNPNYYFLENDTVQIDNVKFIGATMWTKLGERAGIQMKCAQALNDFNYIIRKYPHKLSPRDCVEMCEKSRKFIVKEVNNTSKNIESIVITHHCPVWYGGDDITHAFNIDLSKTIKRFKNTPKAWVYGHTHKNNQLGGILTPSQNKTMSFLCNQFGYKGESQYDEQFNAWKTFNSEKEIVVK